MTSIEELRRLEAEATPGPWVVGPFDLIWPANDVEYSDGKWREKVPEPRIISTSTKGNLSPDEDKANVALIVAMRNALPELLKALEATDELIEALAIYGFPVSDAAETALLNRGAGSREAQRLHKAAKALIAARKAHSPQGGNDAE